MAPRLGFRTSLGFLRSGETDYVQRNDYNVLNLFCNFTRVSQSPTARNVQKAESKHFQDMCVGI